MRISYRAADIRFGRPRQYSIFNAQPT